MTPMNIFLENNWKYRGIHKFFSNIVICQLFALYGLLDCGFHKVKDKSRISNINQPNYFDTGGKKKIILFFY
jgi:hypothetical protein